MRKISFILFFSLAFSFIQAQTITFRSQLNFETAQDTFTLDHPIYSVIQLPNLLGEREQEVYKKSIKNRTFELKIILNDTLRLVETIQLDFLKTKIIEGIISEENDGTEWQFSEPFFSILPDLVDGENIVLFEVSAIGKKNKTYPLASGDFIYNIDKIRLDSILQTIYVNNQIDLQKIQPAWGIDMRHWRVSYNDTYGEIGVKWDNSLRDWEFYLGQYQGDIRQKWNNDWSDWTIKTGRESCTIEARYTSDYTRWVITHKNNKYYLQTNFSDDIRDWNMTDENGIILEVNSYYTDELFEWEITTLDSKTPPIINIAATFISIYSANFIFSR